MRTEVAAAGIPYLVVVFLIDNDAYLVRQSLGHVQVQPTTTLGRNTLGGGEIGGLRLHIRTTRATSYSFARSAWDLSIDQASCDDCIFCRGWRMLEVLPLEAT